MDAKTLDMLADIQRLAIAGSEQTGKRIYHNVQGWPGGAVWSGVRVIEGSCDELHSSEVHIRQGGEQEALYSDGTIHTLAEQRDALAIWIVSNRKQEDAA